MIQCDNPCSARYPVPTALVPCNDDARLLFTLYSGKHSCVTAAMQYSFQSSILQEDHAEMADSLCKFSQEELCHARVLGRVIHALGGNPRFIQPDKQQFWHAGLLCYQYDPGIFLITDLRFKLNAVDELLAAADRVKNQNLRPLLEQLAVENENQAKQLQLIIRGYHEKDHKRKSSACGQL